jgi:hypothetical protein
MAMFFIFSATKSAVLPRLLADAYADFILSRQALECSPETGSYPLIDIAKSRKKHATLIFFAKL